MIRIFQTKGGLRELRSTKATRLLLYRRTYRHHIDDEGTGHQQGEKFLELRPIHSKYTATLYLEKYNIVRNM